MSCIFKMQLAALARDNKAINDVTGLDEHQETIKKKIHFLPQGI